MHFNSAISRIVMLAIAALFYVTPTVSSSTENSEDGTSWRVQRIYVPKDRAEQWPRRADDRYLPMPVEEFERRLAGLNGPIDAAPPAARLISAYYDAQVSDTDALRGESVWEFEHRGKSREIVFLDGCQIALSDCRWERGDGRGDLRAVIGNDQYGRLAVVVDRSGKLRCHWSLRRASYNDGESNFALPLPACPVNVLRLSLPGSQAPSVDRGVVSVLPPQQADQVRWQIEWGGNCHPNLRIVKQDLLPQEQAKLTINQSLIYELSSRGVEMSAEIKLDSISTPLRQIKLQVDRPLAVVQARLDNAELHSAPTAKTDGDAGTTTPQELTLELPAPIQGAGHVLQVKAIAPLPLNTSWQLPIIHLPNAFWQQGSAKLIVLSPMVIDELSTESCRQTGAGSMSGADPGDVIHLQLFDPRPKIGVLISRQQRKLHSTQATSVVLRSTEGVGRCQARFVAEDDERFVLEAEIAPQWIIDNVESTPPGAVADWSQFPSRNRLGKLTVQLSRPLAPNHDLELLITGRRRSSPIRDTLRTRDLTMLQFADCIATRRLIHVQASEAHQLQLRGAEELTRLDPAKLSPADSAQLMENPSGLVFVEDEGARNLAVSLTAETPQYDAEIEVEALVGDDYLNETYRFSIAPQAHEVARLRVRFSQPRTEPVAWKIEGSPETELSARKLTDMEFSSLGGDAWEVLLPTDSGSPFVVVATRRSSLRDDLPLALASVVDAESQRGTIKVISNGSKTPELRSRRIKAIPIQTPQPDRYSNYLAAFRYDPEQDTLLATEPALVIATRSEAAVMKNAWVWQAHLQSRLSSSGAEHLLTCQLENTGRGDVQFEAPPNAQLRAVWVNDQPSIDPATANNQLWKINLPIEVRFVTVVLHWNEERPLRRTISPYAAPWPRCNVPVLSQDWTICLPPNAVLSDAQIGNAHGVDIPWTRRLFGPLARATHSSFELASEGATRAQPMSLTEPIEAPSKTSEAVSPWKITDRDSWSSPGWNQYRFNKLSTSAGQIWVADEPSLGAWTWSLFFLSMSARWWIGSRSLPLDLAFLGTATVVALLVPASWTPFSAAIWLGLAAGQLIVYARRMWPSKSNEADSPPAADPPAMYLGAATSIAGLLLAIAFHGWVQADEPTPTAQAAPANPLSRIQQVLIPVDQDGHPSGGLCFLTESFHEELRRATASIDQGAPQYLITKATYRGNLERDAASGELNGGDWRADLEVESLAKNAVVRLPLGADGAVLVPDGVKLNGQPTTFRWNDASRRLEIELLAPATHQIEVLLRPIPRRDGFDFAVPPVAAAIVEYNHLPANTIEIPSAVGAREGALADERKLPADLREKVRVPLGPAERLILRQPAVESMNSAAAPPFDVDQRYWLHVRPGSVIVDAQILVNSHSGRVQQIQMLADPRLRPLPPADAAANDDASLIAQIKRVAANPNLLQIDLARPIVGEATIKLSFELADASGIGHWHPPKLSVIGAKVTRRWWAATVDSALEANLAQQDATRTLPPQQFAALWGGDRQPQFAWQETDTPSDWAVATQPPQPKLTARYQLLLLAGQREMSVRFSANLAATNGHVFQYRVKVPAPMEIDNVFVDGPNGSQPATWSRHQADAVTVRLATAAPPEQRLSIVGRMPLSADGASTLPADGRFTVPTFDIPDSLAAGRQVIVMRWPEVLVEVANTAQWRSILDDELSRALVEAQRNDQLASAFAHGAKVVSVLEGAPEFPPAVLRIQRNQPQTRAVQITTLNRSAEAWRATVDLDLRIARGVLDTLRFDIPPSWVGPFEITPDIPHSIDEVPGENRRQLVLRPETPMQGSARLRIASPLTLAAGPPSAPLVRLLDASRQSLFFLLPQRLDNQQLSWDTRGMILRPLPDEAAAMITESGKYRVYELRADRGRAVLRSSERSSEKPQVRLADIMVSHDRDGGTFGVAAFDLEPAGATSCDLQLPAGGRLVHAQLDTAPAQISPSGQQRWNIWLGDNKLPHRLEIIYTAQAPNGSGNDVTLVPPTLLGLPVERTLWTVVSPTSAGDAVLPAGAPTPSLRHAGLRVEGALTLLDSAVSLSLDEPKDDVARWYTTWARRFVASRAAMQSAQLSDDETLAAATQLTEIDQEHAQLVRRLGAATVPSPASTGQPAVWEWLQLGDLNQASNSSTAHAALRGQPEPLVVQYPQAVLDGRRARTVTAVLIALLTGAVVLAARRDWISLDPLADKPYVWGLVTGAIWWLWLTPAWLGLVIVAATAFYAWPRIDHAVSRAESAA